MYVRLSDADTEYTERIPLYSCLSCNGPIYVENSDCPRCVD